MGFFKNVTDALSSVKKVKKWLPEEKISEFN